MSSQNKQLFCGNGYTIVKKDNKLFTFGQLCHGDNKYISSFQKANISEEIVNNIKIFSCGPNHAIFLSGDKLYGCGNNYCRELCISDKQIVQNFEEIKNAPSNIKNIICGVNYTILHLDNDKLMVCGYSSWLRSRNSDDNKFTEIKDVPKNIKKIACSETGICIITNDGKLYMRGGIVRNYDNFTEIKDIPNDITDVVCGSFYVALLRSNGKILGYGLIGETNREKFEEIDNVSNIIKMEGNECFLMLLQNDGILLTNCADFSNTDKYHDGKFMRIEKVPNNVREFGCSSKHAVLLCEDGNILLVDYTYPCLSTRRKFYQEVIIQ